MYHAFVRRQITKNFEGLGKAAGGDGSGDMDPRIEHAFAVANAIGGTRHSVEGFRLWLARVYRLFPDLSFEVKRVAVSGWPWNTIATVEWQSTATTATGDPYVNDGVHVVRIKRGKIVSMHVHLDTERVAEVLRIMAGKGFSEAAAAPIVG